MKKNILKLSLAIAIIASMVFGLSKCKPSSKNGGVASDAAQRVYVAPGQKDEVYLFTSGGFNGQLGVYGIPSGRLFRNIPVFSVDAESGYGFTEETKPMLMTSHGFVPWDDSHHPELSKTDGLDDGRWIFINGNNTPRVARINLATMETEEIIELPNSAGNHSSPFCTENTEYVVAGTRFSLPIDGNKDVPIATYKQNFKGTISFIKVNKDNGRLNIGFQLVLPPFDYDLSHSGKGPSHDWSFFTCYNSEGANTLLEVNASQKDKDFILAVNWKKAEELVAQGKAKKVAAKYAHNVYNQESFTAKSTMESEVLQLSGDDLKGICYLIPCPKSPHGCDVDPTGLYFCAGGKLAAVIPCYSFDKMLAAIKNNETEGDVNGIPVLKYKSVLQGEVANPGLGPLHTEFDNEGNAYTSFFISSEVVKWRVKDQQILDRIPSYYSLGHLCVVGGDSKKPYGKYLIAMNKITKDRYLPTGPSLCQSAQLIDISGNKMKLLLDFPTIGEPHYAQACPASLIDKNSVKFFKLENNKHQYVARTEADAKVVRNGNEVHVYMTSIRSHFVPDNIEGIRVGDKVYFHVTNLEQDWDVPHGFAVKGNGNSEILVMPGQTTTLLWQPTEVGITPFYCTDFCSALHQEMQGYVRVSPAGSSTPLAWGTNKDLNKK